MSKRLDWEAANLRDKGSIALADEVTWGDRWLNKYDANRAVKPPVKPKHKHKHKKANRHA